MEDNSCQYVSPPGPHAGPRAFQQQESSPQVPRLFSSKRKLRSLPSLSIKYRKREVRRRLDLGEGEACLDDSCPPSLESIPVCCNSIEDSLALPSVDSLVEATDDVDANGDCAPPSSIAATSISANPVLEVGASSSALSNCDSEAADSVLDLRVLGLDANDAVLDPGLLGFGLDGSVVNLLSLDFCDLLKFADQLSDWDIDFVSLINSTNYYQCHPNDRFDPSSLFTVDAVDSSDLPDRNSEMMRLLNKYVDDFDDASDSDSDIERNPPDNSLGGRVKGILKDWTLSENPVHTKVTSLLQSLKTLPEFADLPAKTSSLLKTPRGKVKINDVPGGGKYYHLGIRKCLAVILKNLKGCHVKLYVNTDGISIYKSKGSELWPILCLIMSIDSVSHIVFPIGFFYDSKKPKNPYFLKDFSEEAESLVQEGLTVGREHFTFSVDGLICDAPGKAVALGIEAPNGKDSCVKCHVVGLWSKDAHRVYYNDESAASRTYAEFLLHMDKKYHKFITPLEKVSTSIIPKYVPEDIMHLLPLGLCRTIIYLWLIGKAPHNIGASSRAKVSERMRHLKNFCPKEFARKPRDTDEVCFFKATEFFQVLLYTGMVVFRKVVSCKKYNNFMYLCVGVRIVLDPTNKRDEVMKKYARKLFLYFIQTFRDEYGIDFITHNFHALTHVVDDLEVFGDLIEASGFKFETFMQYIKFLVHKTSSVLEQLAHRFEELFQNEMLFKQVQKTYFKAPEFFSPHHDGPVIDDLGDPQFNSVKYKFCELTISQPDNCCSLVGGEVVLIRNVCHDKKSQKMSIVGQAFKVKENFFSHPCSSNLLGIFKVSDLSSRLKSWPVDQILQKNYMIPVKNAWVVVPLLDSSIH